MKRFLRMTVVSAMLFALLPLQARAAELLIPVGKIIGLHLRSSGVTDALARGMRKPLARLFCFERVSSKSILTILRSLPSSETDFIIADIEVIPSNIS